MNDTSISLELYNVRKCKYMYNVELIDLRFLSIHIHVIALPLHYIIQRYGGIIHFNYFCFSKEEILYSINTKDNMWR